MKEVLAILIAWFLGLLKAYAEPEAPLGSAVFPRKNQNIINIP